MDIKHLLIQVLAYLEEHQDRSADNARWRSPELEETTKQFTEFVNTYTTRKSRS